MSFKPEPYEEGESVILDMNDDKGTVLTKELADKLNEEQNQEFEQNRDSNPFTNPKPLQFIESRLIISSKDNTTEYLNDIANSLENIRLELGETNLMILGVQNTPWLYQENEYLPVKNALNYLSKKIDKNFDGGFLLNGEAILEFIPHLFWLIRCNASLPYFYISYPKSKTVISICKYGVLHFEFYNQNEKIKILKLMSDLNFKELDNCEDPIEFDVFDGRQIKISS
ncbi:MAG: hypothetical protein M9900_00440 [Flavobacteriales bacterium]|nr:hypothetical protein [Flavobacteriales bacterium]